MRPHSNRPNVANKVYVPERLTNKAAEQQRKRSTSTESSRSQPTQTASPVGSERDEDQPIKVKMPPASGTGILHQRSQTSSPKPANSPLGKPANLREAPILRPPTAVASPKPSTASARTSPFVPASGTPPKATTPTPPIHKAEQPRSVTPVSSYRPVIVSSVAPTVPVVPKPGWKDLLANLPEGIPSGTPASAFPWELRDLQFRTPNITWKENGTIVIGYNRGYGAFYRTLDNPNWTAMHPSLINGKYDFFNYYGRPKKTAKEVDLEAGGRLKDLRMVFYTDAPNHRAFSLVHG